MKHQLIILVIVYYMCTIVDGRSAHQNEKNREVNNNIERKHSSHRPERHSRNRRQSYFSNYPDNRRYYRNNGLDEYLTDMTFSIREIEASLNHLTRNNQYNPFNYDRRDYSCNCEETIRKLLSTVEELASRTKNPPAPPPPSIQVVYIPYKVPENFKGKPNQNITIKPRLIVDDPNMIWMNSPNKDVDETEEEDDGARPGSFKSFASKKYDFTSPLEKRSYEDEATTSKPLENVSCEGAILYCCGKQHDELEKCFANYNCSETFNTRKACDPQNINKIVEKLSSMYGPIKEF